MSLTPEQIEEAIRAEIDLLLQQEARYNKANVLIDTHWKRVEIMAIASVIPAFFDGADAKADADARTHRWIEKRRRELDNAPAPAPGQPQPAEEAIKEARVDA